MVAQFIHKAHCIEDMTIMVIDLASSCDSCLHKTWENRLIRTLGEQIDQDPENPIRFWNESRGIKSL